MWQPAALVGSCMPDATGAVGAPSAAGFMDVVLCCTLLLELLRDNAAVDRLQLCMIRC